MKAHHLSTFKKKGGFSLLEVLLVLVLVGLVLTFAIPQYQTIQQNQQTQEAKLLLSQALLQAQQCYHNQLPNIDANEQCDYDFQTSQSQEVLKQISDGLNNQTQSFTITFEQKEQHIVFRAQLKHSGNHPCAVMVMGSDGVMEAQDQDGQNTTLQCW